MNCGEGKQRNIKQENKRGAKGSDANKGGCRDAVPPSAAWLKRAAQGPGILWLRATKLGPRIARATQ